MGYQCFHCGENTVSWVKDYNYEDYGYVGDGIVHSLYCSNCGAEIEYKINLETKEDRIMNEITNFCEECLEHEECCEDECILYRIEKIIKEKEENGNS